MAKCPEPSGEHRRLHYKLDPSTRNGQGPLCRPETPWEAMGSLTRSCLLSCIQLSLSRWFSHSCLKSSPGTRRTRWRLQTTRWATCSLWEGASTRQSASTFLCQVDASQYAGWPGPYEPQTPVELFKIRANQAIALFYARGDVLTIHRSIQRAAGVWNGALSPALRTQVWNLARISKRLCGGTLTMLGRMGSAR